MNEIEYNDIKKNLNFGSLKYYNIYNADLDNELFIASDYYLKNNEDENISQKLHVLFIDIEVINLKTFDKAEGEISSIVSYSNFEQQYDCYFFLKQELVEKFGIYPDIQQLEYQELINNLKLSFKKQLLESKHIVENENINIVLFNNEKELMISFCNNLKKKDPAILSGYFSDVFDWPYIFKRLIILFGEETAISMLSKFNYVKLQNNLIKIPEYSICDLAHIYKPRGDGGLNYGKKQSSYSLDFISNYELNLKKYEYKNKNLSLDAFYFTDPINYLLYNIIDVALCVRLNQKLKHIELHNTIRRIMKIPFSKSMVGNSVLFDGFILNKFNKENKKVRFGINIETQKTITKENLVKILKPKNKKGYIEPAPITSAEYNSIAAKYDGAYVKESQSRIINDGSLIIDLDASSLYPSMMLQHNISFDVYRARIIPPITYKFLELIKNTLGKENTPSIISANIFNIVEKYVNEEKPGKKEKSKKNIYYIIMYLIEKLYSSKIELNRIFNPKNDTESILLIQYLIPLLDIINNIHPQKEVYNDFIFDYLFNSDKLKEKYKTLYVINNIHLPNQNILELSVDETIKYINSYAITIAGTCFVKHQTELGLFTEMLNNMATMRKEYKSKLKDYDKNSKEYDFYNSRQLSFKTVMNTSYGVMGLSVFRYSNHWLAQSITSSGRLSLKVAQYLTEEHLKNNY